MDRSRTSNGSTAATEASVDEAIAPAGRIKGHADAELPRTPVSSPPNSARGDGKARRPRDMPASIRDPSEEETANRPDTTPAVGASGPVAVPDKAKRQTISEPPERVVGPDVSAVEDAESLQRSGDSSQKPLPITDAAATNLASAAPAEPRQALGRMSILTGQAAIMGPRHPASTTPDLQAGRVPVSGTPSGPYRIRLPRYGQGCACPYDVASSGHMCGGRSDWVRPGGLEPCVLWRSLGRNGHLRML